MTLLLFIYARIWYYLPIMRIQSTVTSSHIIEISRGDTIMKISTNDRSLITELAYNYENKMALNARENESSLDCEPTKEVPAPVIVPTSAAENPIAVDTTTPAPDCESTRGGLSEYMSASTQLATNMYAYIAANTIVTGDEYGTKLKKFGYDTAFSNAYIRLGVYDDQSASYVTKYIRKCDAQKTLFAAYNISPYTFHTGTLIPRSYRATKDIHCNMRKYYVDRSAYMANTSSLDELLRIDFIDEFIQQNIIKN